MLRFWHWIYRHNWRERITFCPGTGKLQGWAHMDDNRWGEVHGFSEIILTCQCGAIRTKRIVGRVQTLPGDSEVDALRKMAGLK